MIDSPDKEFNPASANLSAIIKTGEQIQWGVSLKLPLPLKDISFVDEVINFTRIVDDSNYSLPE